MLNFSPLSGSSQQVLICACMGLAGSLHVCPLSLFLYEVALLHMYSAL